MSAFKTPTNVKFRNIQDEVAVIPGSPLMTPLGRGTGVSVYRLKRSPRIGKIQSPWAVKKVLRNLETKCYADRLKEEADILKNLKHPNIVGFRAFVKAEDGRDCLAMEECDTSIGDLIEQRLDDELGPFPANHILKVARHISSALDYLHTECHLLHGDIKSMNILVKGDFEVIKLCDFGVSVPLNADGTLKESRENFIGTECWSAPEALSEDGIITHKADIFPFGLVLWEMISLQIPHMDILDCDESMNISDCTESSSDMSSDFISKFGTRPQLPDTALGDEYKPVIDLFYMCTEENPSQRPSAKQIIKFLEPA
ncbi:hypothetical protein L9F63_006312 [Diploptera punctata]|uniref:Protein kinase domain-containing protein n=1 Tax=Diploptera punctata TaxID=6984 RepID=A0AAD7ZAU5_DIPPU|nr:hypothetical protein L9F63_006312 [Diploptera punctata]